jgi:hypothetical protein
MCFDYYSSSTIKDFILGVESFMNSRESYFSYYSSYKIFEIVDYKGVLWVTYYFFTLVFDYVDYFMSVCL